jgi:hypothetical protein
MASPPLAPTNATEIQTVFNQLEVARKTWQARKDPYTLAPKRLLIIGRVAFWFSTVAFIAFLVSWQLGNEFYRSLSLLIVASGLLVFELAVGYATYLDYRRMARGNDDFEASVRHTLEINALALELSQSSLPSLRLVYRSRKRVFSALGTTFSFFAIPNLSTFITQAAAFVALITSVVTLVIGKNGVGIASIPSEQLYGWALGLFALVGLAAGAVFALSALNESRPWIRKELVALEDAICKLEQDEQKVP